MTPEDSPSEVLVDIVHIADSIHRAANVRKKSRGLDELNMETLYSLRAGSTKLGDYETAANVELEIIKREVKAAQSNPGVKSYSKSVLALAGLIRTVSTPPRRRSAAAMIADLTKWITTKPPWLERAVREAPKAPSATDINALAQLTAAQWNKFCLEIANEGGRRAMPVVDRIGGDEPRSVGLDVAARLSRMAEREHHPAVTELPIYDPTDRRVRISRVTVTGFRGSAATLSLDLTKNGSPVDALLWGDNGVGKSTIADGIEFALQRRVDRSADFNSSLRAAVRNLSASEARAVVDLDDGTVVERWITKNAAGRDEPSSMDVRPGFRIAPLVIRRSDILRFLDTDALSRGTVFFDYFPDPYGQLGQRPDEELKTLEEERFLLRVARDDLAEQLRGLYPGESLDFTDSGQLESFVDKILNGVETDEIGDPFEALSSETRAILVELRAAQRRLAEIRKKLARGVQTLNPVAYRAQLSRIVPILSAVTQDLTLSFKRITRAQHVTALKVLVARSGPVSLDVVVEFDNGTSALPQQVFSEGYKDLIALLFFLTVTRRASDFGQAKVLVLDDALQSVDGTIRLALMDYVLEEFKDWQLIVSGHDRSWLSQLRRLFAVRGRTVVEKTISRWSFSHGIEVRSSGFRTAAESLRAMIAQVDERLTAAATGLLLEEIAQELSWRLGASVTRREGDRYTLGDLWPGVSRRLRTTTLKATSQSIDRLLEIRNLLGAHYNSWADSISWSDVENLAVDVLDLYDHVYCATCASWISKTGELISCRCGSSALTKI